MLIRTRRQLILGGGVVGLALLALTAVPIFAQTPTPEHDHSPTHEQMHQMMDAMHGEGFSERMHAAMPESEEMMEQCAQMMGMMQHMQGMMGGAGMSGMMGGRSMGGMMDGGTSPSMPGMMPQMPGR